MNTQTKEPDRIQLLQIQAKTADPVDFDFICRYFNKLFKEHGYFDVEVKIKTERTITKQEKLINAICETLGVEWYEVLMGGRKIQTVYARMIFTHKMLCMGHDLIDISKRLRRDRTTIHHYKMKYLSEFAYNPVFRNYVIKVS